MRRGSRRRRVARAASQLGQALVAGSFTLATASPLGMAVGVLVGVGLMWASVI